MGAAVSQPAGGLPEGFVLDAHKAIALPPGFKLDSQHGGVLPNGFVLDSPAPKPSKQFPVTATDNLDLLKDHKRAGRKPTPDMPGAKTFTFDGRERFRWGRRLWLWFRRLRWFYFWFWLAISVSFFAAACLSCRNILCGSWLACISSAFASARAGPLGKVESVLGWLVIGSVLFLLRKAENITWFTHDGGYVWRACIVVTVLWVGFWGLLINEPEKALGWIFGPPAALLILIVAGIFVAGGFSTKHND